MPEIEREELLASRQEELQRLQDKLNLDHMLKVQSGGNNNAADSEQHVSHAAKREWHPPLLFPKHEQMHER